jgi:hypothetical protein
VSEVQDQLAEDFIRNYQKPTDRLLASIQGVCDPTLARAGLYPKAVHLMPAIATHRGLNKTRDTTPPNR